MERVLKSGAAMRAVICTGRGGRMMGVVRGGDHQAERRSPQSPTDQPETRFRQLAKRITGRQGFSR